MFKLYQYLHMPSFRIVVITNEKGRVPIKRSSV
jgi:hypothetical protein